VAVTPNPSAKSQQNLRCLFNKFVQVDAQSTGIIGVVVAVDPPALNEVIIAASSPDGQGLQLFVEKSGCDAHEAQTKWHDGGINNRNAVFCPSIGANTFRLLGMKEGLVARVNASVSCGKKCLAGSWVSMLVNKGGRSLEETTFSADDACSAPHWEVCTINDLLSVNKIDKKSCDSAVGGAVISISSVAVKAEDTDLASSAVLEIFEGSPSSDEKMLGAVLSVYAASDSGGGKVFLNWGSYWATFQCDRMFKSSFPFEVARDKDTRIAVSVCSAGSLGPKQARLVLTWSPCIPSGA
jgi:hypothetical protein